MHRKRKIKTISCNSEIMIMIGKEAMAPNHKLRAQKETNGLISHSGNQYTRTLSFLGKKINKAPQRVGKTLAW